MLDHWNFEQGTNLEVQAFTNCDEVELMLNHTSLGSKKIEKGEEPILYWVVPYQNGELIAIGKRNNAVVATDTLVTSTKALNINLAPNKKMLKANGADLVYIQVSIRDRKGNIVPENKLINFEVKGPAKIAGVANSDIFSDEPWQDNKRTTVNGKCLVVLRSTNDSGKVELTAKTKGVKPSILEFNSDGGK